MGSEMCIRDSCERVPPDISMATAVAMFATRMQIPVRINLENFRFLRCLDGTHDEIFGSSVNNLHMTDWYEDASMAIHSGFIWHTYGLVKTEMFYSTDPNICGAGTGFEVDHD